jgi:hypothetical protein
MGFVFFPRDVLGNTKSDVWLSILIPDVSDSQSNKAVIRRWLDDILIELTWD